LEQLGVLGCRLVDAAASGENKRLIHDAYELIWNGIELLADPSTTLAVAEVTANLCHALEMEEKYPRNANLSESDKANNRRERNEQQRRTYHGKMFDDSIFSVEECILSSLRTRSPVSDDESLEIENDIEIPRPAHTLEGKTDVKFLREKIEDRAFLNRRRKNLKYSRQTTPMISNLSSLRTPQNQEPDNGNDGVKEEKIDPDIEDAASFEPPLTATRVTSISVANREYRSSSGQKEGETSTDFFYRVLDDTFSSNKIKIKSPRERKKPVAKKSTSSSATPQKSTSKKRNISAIIIVMLVISGFLLAFGGFAIYGALHYFFGAASISLSHLFSGIPPLSQPSIPAAPTTSQQSEVVIRIVREIVHVDSDGNVIKTIPDENSSGESEAIIKKLLGVAGAVPDKK
jgi:hypothetical protein